MASITLAEMETRVYHRVEENSLFYTKVQVDRAINEGLRVLNLFTGYYQDSFALTPTAPGRVFYDVPPQILFPMQVIYERKPLSRGTLSGTARILPDIFLRSSLQFGPPFYWVPIGTRKFAITPQDHIGGGAIEVVGVAEPPLLVALTDISYLPDEYDEMVEDYSFYTLVLNEGGQVFSDASKLYQKFLSRMKEFNIYQDLKNPQYFVEAESRS